MHGHVKLCAISALTFFLGSAALAAEYHVSKTGSDENSGSENAPFLTINHAAQLAEAGDHVIVHEGVYRETVVPKNGSESADSPIVYRAAEGADVVIKGSEIVTGWVKEDNLWVITVEGDFFGRVNPFIQTVQYPTRVRTDTQFNGTGWQLYGLDIARGNVFLNEEPLKQVLDESELSEANTWYTDFDDDDNVTIWANFGTTDPNSQLTEITVRDRWFAPTEIGLKHIHVKGFTMMHAATHWAPPSVYQPGGLEPQGGIGWVITNNEFMHSRALCLSVGFPSRGGTFNAKRLGSGHHTISHNYFRGCGQGAIAGQAYNDHSVISYNVIEDTNKHVEFGGWETAAIKLHNTDHTIVSNNIINGVYTFDGAIGAAHGIWIDYKNTNVEVANNVILNTEAFPILFEANWDGPHLIANNIIDGSNSMNVTNFSTTEAGWIHNLFINTAPAWENQSYGGRAKIRDEKWMKNIFMGDAGMVGALPIFERNEYMYNLYMNGAQKSSMDKKSRVSKTDPKPSVEFKDGEVTVKFTLKKRDLAKKSPPLDELLGELVIPKDADGNEMRTAIDADILGNPRDPKKPQWGPFEDLQKGENVFTISIK